MIKNIIKYFVCKIKQHDMVDVGSCPFTGKTYVECTRCGVNLEK